MTWAATATIGATVVGGLMSKSSAKKSASKQAKAIRYAARTQAETTYAALALKREEFAAAQTKYQQEQEKYNRQLAQYEQQYGKYMEREDKAYQQEQDRYLSEQQRYERALARQSIEQQRQDVQYDQEQANYLQNQARYNELTEREALQYQQDQEKYAADMEKYRGDIAYQKTQREQYEEYKKLLAPFASAGDNAIYQQRVLTGLEGAPKQQEAIDALSASPLYQELAAQGEEAILQKAAATGGVRGGNTAGILARYRPSMLKELIEQQYNRLGGLAQFGFQGTNSLGAASRPGEVGYAPTAPGAIASNIGYTPSAPGVTVGNIGNAPSIPGFLGTNPTAPIAPGAAPNQNDIIALLQQLSDAQQSKYAAQGAQAKAEGAADQDFLATLGKATGFGIDAYKKSIEPRKDDTSWLNSLRGVSSGVYSSPNSNLKFTAPSTPTFM